MMVFIDGEKLRRRMKERGMTYRTLGRAIGKMQGLISATIHNGKCSVETLDKICKALKYPAQWLITPEARPATKLKCSYQINERRLWELVGAVDLPMITICKAMGLTDNSLNKALKGEVVNPKTASKICAYFNVSREELIVNED